MLTLASCEDMDRRDCLGPVRKRFVIPDGVVYLDGNSLGALPAGTPARLQTLIGEEWGRDLVRSWNAHDWIGMPAKLGALIAPIVGAKANEVIVADSTSVNLFKLAAAAVRAQEPRRVVLTDELNFPTDLYVLQGLREFLGDRVELRMVPRAQLADSLNENVALLALTHVDFRSGEIHDMRWLNAAAHRAGALALWDLSHSAGALELFLDRDETDFAIGCGYKYLNGGPGAPAFLFVAERLQEQLQQPLSGWMGHAAPFDFGPHYRAGAGVARMLCGTPPILSMAALEEGLKTFDGIALRTVREKSKRLGELFLTLLRERDLLDVFALASPAEADARASQLSLRHAHGYAIMQALIAEGVIGDFRAPDILRFGFAPLYTRYIDVWQAVEQLDRIVRSESWRAERFRVRSAVT